MGLLRMRTAKAEATSCPGSVRVAVVLFMAS